MTSPAAPEIRLVQAPTQAVTVDSPHVLLVLDQIAATLGGGERIVRLLARLLPDAGYRVSILTLSLEPSSPFLDDVPCPVYLLPLGRTWDVRALRAAVNLRTFLREQQVRLVQTFFESSDLWVGTVARTVPGIKLIWSRRDMGILRTPKHRGAYRLLRRLPHAVVAVSEQVRRHAIEVDGIAPDRVLTVYNGVIAPAGPSRRIVNGPLVVLAVGNLRPVKGFDVLVEAVALVCRSFPEAVFQIAGKTLDREYTAHLLKRIDELGLGQRVRMLGEITDVTSLLQQADVFVTPSRSEGFSNAIVEAMAQGLPVVATDVGGNAEAVENEITGLIVPSEDPALLAKALCRLLADDGLRSRLGHAGFVRVRALFSLEEMVRRTTHLYQRLSQ